MTKSNFSWPALLSVVLFTSLVWSQPLPGGPRAPSLFLIIFGAVLLFRKKVTFSDKRMHRMLLVLAVIWVPACISTFSSYEPEKSLQLVVMLPLFFLLSVAGYYVLDNYLTQKLLLGIITILCCFWLFDASIQLIFGKDLFGIELFDGRRVNAPFKHLRLGLFVSILLPVVLVQLERYGLFWQALYLLVSIVIVTSTGIRTNLLIVILAVGLYIIGRQKARWLLVVIPFILIAGVLAASFSEIAQKKLNSFSTLPTTYEEVNKLSSYRLDIWQASSNMLLENPFSGVGARSFSEAYNDHSSPGNRFYNSDLRAHHAHHPIISIAAETGFPGLFGFLLAAYMLARWGRDSDSRALANPWAQILILIAFPIQSMPIFFTLWWFPFIIFVLICYLHTIQLKKQKDLAMKSNGNKTVLWWGRSDPQYSRNGIIRQLFSELDWNIIDFKPRISELAGLEAWFKKFPEVDLVWVPCFRQKDLAAAARWANKKRIPLVFDPLISAYDKQVWERKKFSEQSRQASKLLDWERSLFLSANHVIADTKQHAEFYAESFGVNPEQLHVLPVSAEESLFFPRQSAPENEPLKVLFYGSFIGLQGPDVIATAILLYTGPEVEWYFIGDGPLRLQTEEKLSGLNNAHFSDWLPYEQLPERISQVDLCLGIFGSTQKTQRVIPNKVYQALACARPVITCTSNAYPESLKDTPDSGLFFVPANDPEALAQRLREFVQKPQLVKDAGQYALVSYQKYFSNNILKDKLSSLLQSIETRDG